VNAQAAGRIAAIRPHQKQSVDEPNDIGGMMRVGAAALAALVIV
jgi:hypothetical protein